MRSTVSSTVDWVRWHALELAAVTGPLVLAALVTPWLAVLAVPALVLWAVYETRTRTVSGTAHPDPHPDPRTVHGPVPRTVPGNGDRAPSVIESAAIDRDRRAL